MIRKILFFILFENPSSLNFTLQGVFSCTSFKLKKKKKRGLHFELFCR